ncbi:hypothetical protein AB0M57_13965 [Streptomyces sp. NPDC051597]
MIALLGLMPVANVLSVLTSDFAELLVSWFLTGNGMAGSERSRPAWL